MRALRRLLAASLALFIALQPAHATVNTAVSSTNVLGNGSLTQFGFNFIAVAASYVTVIYTDPSGNQTVLQPNQYTISLNAPVQGATWGVGGVVTYAPGGAPIPSGSTLTIARTLPLVQAISLQNQASYGAVAKSAERASDLLAMQIQQISNNASRGIFANPANSSPPAPLPPAAQVANQALCFDGTGNNVVACAGLPAGTVSSAMQVVINAPSIAAGRIALGLGGIAVEGIGAGLQDDGNGNARTISLTEQDAASMTVPTSFHTTTRIATGPFTYTLAPSSSYWNGFSFSIVPIGSAITLTPNAGDQINGYASGASTTLQPGTTSTVTTDGAGNWFVTTSYTAAGFPTVPGHYTGEVVKMRGSSCPVGTVAEDGSALNRTTYAALFAVLGTTWGAGDGLTTFNLPNAGGQFDRSWISGQTVDAGRVFGSTQLDQLQDHTHTYQLTGNQNSNLISNGADFKANLGSGGAATTVPISGRHGTETRPTNITVLSCIFTGVIH